MRGTTVGRQDSDKRRTALILAAVALGFFVAIVLKYWLAK
jgi:hypothetical protein